MQLLDNRLETSDDLLDALLVGTVDGLDIPPELAEEAVSAYVDVGAWLAQYGDQRGGADWDVYPQGSFNLGTVVRPLYWSGDYDIDLVCLRSLSKVSVTQAELKAEVGVALGAYVRAQGLEGVVLRSTEGRRCWTLDFGGFHLDVLPAIPDTDSGGSGILLTDREMVRWLNSDPKGYASWFKERTETQFLLERARMAELRKSTVAAVPEWAVRTPLQRAVQTLKRHRDIHFQADLEDRPPSILISTLAAQAYDGEPNLYRAVTVMAKAMPGLVESSNGVWVVANPVQEQENFADKWAKLPGRADKFFSWLQALLSDLESVGQERGGIAKVGERFKSAFGEEPVSKSLERLGNTFRDGVRSSTVRMAPGTGALSLAGAGRKVPLHTFYGDHPPD